jgi:spore maturation protein CgeB
VKILYTGPLGAGATCEMRRRALERLGHATIPVDYQPLVQAVPRLARRVQWRLRAGSMVRRYNRALLAALAHRPEMLWVDKGLFVHPAVLHAARRAGVRHLVHYSPDNYLLAQNTSRHLGRSLALYDLIVTTKTHNLTALAAAGARRVVLSGNAYDPEVHRPRTLDPSESAALACDVSFIGRWEPQRERLLALLAAGCARLSIRGPGWERARIPAVRRAATPGPVLGHDYAKAIAAAKINLGLLSRLADDAITQRSIELPACGAFMLAERTAEHLAHFRDGVEAAFFDGPDDLCAQVRHYLGHEAERARIAAAGRARCEQGAYSYDARLRAILMALEAAA